MSLRLKIILGALVIFAGFIIFRIVFVFGNNIKISGPITANISSAINGADTFKSENPLAKDSDHDGLSDRDEVIYGTDPFNKDSDGDGFLDGEEVATGHNPLDPRDSGKNKPTGNTALAPTNNMTDRLLDMGLASVVDDSGSIDPAIMTTGKYNKVMADISNTAVAYFNIPPLNDSDIIISQDNGPTEITKYLNTITSILGEGIFSFSQTTSTPDPIYYEKIYYSLKSVSVPSSWKELHKKTAMNFLSLADLFKALSDQNIQDDPVKASFALQYVQTIFLNLQNILTEAANLATKQKVPLDSIAQMLQSANSFPQSQ